MRSTHERANNKNVTKWWEDAGEQGYSENMFTRELDKQNESADEKQLFSYNQITVIKTRKLSRKVMDKTETEIQFVR